MAGTFLVAGQVKWSDLPTGHMAGGLYSPHRAAAIRLRPPGCGVGTGGVGSSMLEASCPPDSLPLSLPLPLPPTHPCKAIVAKAPKALTHRSTTLCGEAASSEPAPLDACSLRNPTGVRAPQQQHLVVVWDSRWPAGFMNQQYSMLLRQHRQWCLPTGLVRDQY